METTAWTPSLRSQIRLSYRPIIPKDRNTVGESTEALPPGVENPVENVPGMHDYNKAWYLYNSEMVTVEQGYHDFNKAWYLCNGEMVTVEKGYPYEVDCCIYNPRMEMIEITADENMPAASAAEESSEALTGIENVPGKLDFTKGDKVWYKGEMVTVVQVYPYEYDCVIYIPSLCRERSVLVTKVMAVASIDLSEGAVLGSVYSSEVVNLASITRRRGYVMLLILFILTALGSILFCTASSAVATRDEFNVVFAFEVSSCPVYYYPRQRGGGGDEDNA